MVPQKGLLNCYVALFIFAVSITTNLHFQNCSTSSNCQAIKQTSETSRIVFKDTPFQKAWVEYCEHNSTKSDHNEVGLVTASTGVESLLCSLNPNSFKSCFTIKFLQQELKISKQHARRAKYSSVDDQQIPCTQDMFLPLHSRIPSHISRVVDFKLTWVCGNMVVHGQGDKVPVM